MAAMLPRVVEQATTGNNCFHVCSARWAPRYRGPPNLNADEPQRRPPQISWLEWARDPWQQAQQWIGVRKSDQTGSGYGVKRTETSSAVTLNWFLGSQAHEKRRPAWAEASSPGIGVVCGEVGSLRTLVLGGRGCCPPPLPAARR
uniref:Uncharacterized protein n=1 Tax=Eutreptiella gymnastica TaxID=73025 RepID=A0A7S1I4K2_9EUGL